jgi:trehalose/maltose hydrolase-like predicted phosphorylase
MDLADTMGNSAAGIHAAAAGGVWMGLVLGLGGVREMDDALRLRPVLPDSVRGLSFRVRWRGTPLAVEVRPGRWRVEPLRARHAPFRLAVGGRSRRVEGGRPVRGQVGT